MFGGGVSLGDDFRMSCHAGEYQPFRSNVKLNGQYWALRPLVAGILGYFGCVAMTTRFTWLENRESLAPEEAIRHLVCDTAG